MNVTKCHVTFATRWERDFFNPNPLRSYVTGLEWRIISSLMYLFIINSQQKVES